MPEWSADVIVVGYGGAGAMAALAASTAGAKVLVLEKAEAGGGSTHEAGGSLRPPLDPGLAARHYAALSCGTTSLEVMEALAEGEAALPDKLTSLGGRLVPIKLSEVSLPLRHAGSAYPDFEGAAGLGTRCRVEPRPGQGGGEALWTLIASHVRAASTEIALGMRGSRLLRGSTGAGDRVDAIEAADSAGRVTRFTARHGIVLTCGGFAWNDGMTRDYLGSDIARLSPPGRATGDGIRMAQGVGAALWHMNAIAAGFGYRFPGHEAAFFAQIPAPGYFVVDRRGRRYCDESSIDGHGSLNVMGGWHPETGQQDRVPSYVIFDEATRTAGRVFNQDVGYNRHYAWSTDNGAEIEKGWIHSAGSARELAGKLGIPGDELTETLDAFNRGVDAGEDAFSRPAEQLAPLAARPLYGVPLWPALLNTQGGPQRNRSAQILDAYGDPIPGLFSAGELGSAWGKLYPGSGNVSEAIVFGEIAGRNAVALGG
jgi:succinate dehydrogenase/fumarate reductase flavoprotein subunit